MSEVSDLTNKRGRPKGIPGTANRTVAYVCMVDGAIHERDHLFAKRVTFAPVAGGRSTSRTVGFICLAHMQQDPAFQQFPYTESPGMRRNDNAAP